MEYSKKVISLAVLLLFLLQGAMASLYMDIKLISYKHSCDEDIWPVDSDCDPMFTFCVDRPKTKLRFERSSCTYSFVSQSGHFQNDRFINFQTVYNKRGVPVPWIFEINKLLDPKFELGILVYDHDNFDDDHMVTFSKEMQLPLYGTKETARYSDIRLKKGSHIFKYEIRLYCHPHYYGPDCQTKCLAQNDASGRYTCEPGTGRKLCLKGWNGKACNKDIDECALRYCKVGKCENLPGDYSCLCPDYFTGRNCSVMSNPCGSNPCRHGSICQGDPVTFTYKCLCQPGWEGFNCHDKSDPCDDKTPPCLHEGECQSSEDNFSYSCICTYGWVGKNCEERLDPCADVPCVNGASCVGNGKDLTYECFCPNGWVGERCETKFEPCASSPCKNRGHCDEDISTHSYKCHCGPGWEGELCDVRSDPCVIGQPCRNGGVCESSDDNSTYNCDCQFGWEGKTCDKRIDPCDKDPCQHGGSCRGNSEDLTFACYCSPSWTGDRCQERVRHCDSSPCRNQGVCQEGLDYYTYNCTCGPEWEGYDCGIRSDPCLLNPCYNNGTCVAWDRKFNYYCSCLKEFEGSHCETERIDLTGKADNQRATQANSSAVDWRVPVAVVGAAMLLIVLVIFIVFFRRRQSKSKLQYVSDTLPPVVVFATNGEGNHLAFENQAYTQVNRVNQQIEIGRGDQDNVFVPTTPTDDDDLFNPVKPSFVVDDESPGAVGGACSNEESGTQKAAAKDCDMDTTDLKCSRVSTLSRRPQNQRADENPYQDFKSLSMREPKENNDIEELGAEEEEDHYQKLDDVLDSVRNSHAADNAEEKPPALPPFNFGGQRNPLCQISTDMSSLESDSSDYDAETPGVSHYQEPDDNTTSPDDVYSEVDKKRHERDTLPRRPRNLDSVKSASEAAGHSSDSSKSHYHIPSGVGPKSDSATTERHVYDNPKESAESPYDVPRSAPVSSGSDVNSLFANNNPWTPDPFENSSGGDNNTTYQNDNHPAASAIYDNDDHNDDSNSDEENQEDIAQLKKEVREFLEETGNTNLKDSSVA